MASVLAIVSKAQFEEIAKKRGGAQIGDVLGLDRYNSTHRALSPLEGGGALFMVTVRPDDVLWIVGVLEGPSLKGDHWAAKASTVAIADATALKSKLRFENGKGVPTEPGKMAMSLQTPRTVTVDDEKLLRALLGGPAPAAPERKVAAPKEKPRPLPEKPKASPPAPVTSSGWLGAADASLRAGDAKAALRTLLTAWRELRHAALAETIEQVSAFVTQGQPPLAGKKLGEKVTAWNERVAAADPADFGVLAHHLFLVNSGKEVGAHLEQLGKWPADPRLSRLMHELAVKVPFTASSAKPFWRSLFTTLPTVGDPRTPRALDAADARFAEVFAGRDDYLQWLPNQTKKIRAALATLAEHPLDDATLAGLEALRAFVADRAKPTRGAEQLGSLIDEVYEDPIADAPREVLADALLDAGDPRGDFLVLQMAEAHGRALTREEKRREKDLLEEHADAWLGPLAGWTRKGDRAFRRGFLSRCTIEQKSRNAGEFPDIPAWATVEEVNVAAPMGLPLVGLRRLRAVRRLVGLSQEAFLAAARGEAPAPHLEELLAICAYGPELFEAIGAAPGLPALRRLRLVIRGRHDAPRPDVAGFAASFQRLPQLAWLRTELGIETTRANFTTRSVDVALERAGTEVIAHLRVHAEVGAIDGIQQAMRALARVGFITRSRVTLWEYPGWMKGKDVPAELRTRLPAETIVRTGLPQPEVEYVMLTTSDDESEIG